MRQVNSRQAAEYGVPTPADATDLPADKAGDALVHRWVLERLGEGVCVLDAALRVTAWNARFAELTGLDAAAIRPGVHLRELLIAQATTGEFGDVEPHAEAEQRIAQLRQDAVTVNERLRADGTMIEVRRSPTPDGGVVVVVADITGRKAAEASLAERQRTLALLLENTEQGFWFIDNELRTTDANPAMCNMLGLSLPQMMGRGIYEFVDDENAATFRQHVALRQQGHADGYEISLRRADGSAVHCFNNATPLLDASGQKRGAVGMFSDIGRLKQAEQEIRLTGALLAQKSHVLEITLDSLSQGVLTLDAEGRATAYNRQFLSLMEIPDALMQTRPTLDEVLAVQIARGDFPGELGTPEAVARRRQSSRYQRTRRDGMVLEVQVHAAADGSQVRTYSDVTADVRAQRALSDSEARFRRMADAAPALIWESAPDGTAIWFNQRWLTYTGRSMAAELARTWSDRLHADDIERCRNAFADAAARHRPFSVEFRVLRGDGRLAWIVDSGAPRIGADGRFEGFIAYGWDITERKAAEAALLAAKDEAERANRAKSEFLSRMSHELRTPLNAVLGFGQLLEYDAADPLSAAQRARVQELLRGGRHLLSLINDVLDLARIEAGTLQLDLQPVDVAEVVGDCLRLVQPMADARGIEIVVQAGGDGAGLVLADPTRLKQVLLNLLSNAIKYNHHRGRVQLDWVLEPGARQVRIGVHDTGPGLSPAEQGKLFQAFERLDAERSSVEGAGIGLALSKWLVDLMRGEIGVHSQPGKGSVFWVLLARAERPASTDAAAPTPEVPAAPQAAPAAAATATRPRRVLYIEDNEVNQLLMEGMLAQRPNIELSMAGLPLQGLAMALAQPPDLLLLDIQLPGMSGFEVLRELRSHPETSDLPVVAVSANALDSDREQAAQAGFADYITKPIDLPRLLAVVDRLLAG